MTVPPAPQPASATHTLRPALPGDVPALAALNDAAAPAVNALGVEGLAAHLPRCDLALVVDDAAGRPQALILALTPGADYDSENYRWFAEHRPGSMYVDRIVVAPSAHGHGIGRALHDAVVERARALGLDEVTCEVNLDPPNPQSLAFHRRLGFAQIGEQSTHGGAVRVAMLMRAVAAPGAR
ncbi:GNAT family N-acetyltransferase [Cellulomonas timonensis]|uniref:GNAT family N-acetyltransferase n=1 Tax=Cellulomonas timonensis TaxID=1689271 RepID=UPI00082D35DC|nr:GNAT family N-acetyltransferase [Cellulomonas timonensis]